MPVDWGLARDYAARDVDLEETPVTEAEWLAAADSWPMLQFLFGSVSDRKLRLFEDTAVREGAARLERSARHVAPARG
jgi:hypothetical protein